LKTFILVGGFSCYRNRFAEMHLGVARATYHFYIPKTNIPPSAAPVFFFSCGFIYFARRGSARKSIPASTPFTTRNTSWKRYDDWNLVRTWPSETY